ncbi:MFS transporter [Rothia sp. AR01]|uniref:Lysosomal dipeptide transporter MFSD1 n=1 Tax=Rothia santali TaxID=2949643 RepID=A0A9X2HCI7_9MICC|nr:MFS transporter [Rothia santali]MCP3424594.1 MFS transporter [Rothia santali]
MTTRNSKLKWIIWSVGLCAYLIAVVNRSSFSALGPVAQEHFSAEATTLSTFVVLQLVVYAGCQIPVGIGLDRFGVSWVVATGLAAMSLGQLALGATESIPVAIAARVVMGAGDACIFTSLVRLVAEWFTRRQTPVVNQATGLVGQVGQLLAIAPLAALVGAAGWFAGFAALAGFGAVVMVLVALLLRDGPGVGTLLERLTGRNRVARPAAAPESVETGMLIITEVLPVVGPGSSGVLPALRSLARRPGIRLAFWIHFATMFSADSFLLLWGTPFLTGGLGYPFAAAAGVLNAAVISSMVTAVLFGPILSRFARHRVRMAFYGVVVMLGSWAVLLAWPGAAPVWVAGVVAVVMGAGIPLSMIAFDVVRSHAPARQLGIATGLANMGGFTAALVAILLIGVALDLQGSGTPETYDLGSFKVAMALQFPLWLLGMVMILIERPKAQRDLDRHTRRP